MLLQIQRLMIALSFMYTGRLRTEGAYLEIALKILVLYWLYPEWGRSLQQEALQHVSSRWINSSIVITNSTRKRMTRQNGV